MKGAIAVVLVVAAYVLLTQQTVANDEATVGPRVEFDHLGGTAQAKSISAKPGQVITIVIRNTCAEEFIYELGGIPLIPPDASGLASADSCTPTDHTLTQIHDAQFGGYYVRVRPKSPGTPIMATTGSETMELKDLTFLVSVETSQWDIAFAGGFTISELTNPVFAAKQNDMMESVVVRDRAAEDDVALGVSGMIHMYHRKRPSLALTFGLSAGNDSDVAYMSGVTYRFSDKGAVTAGYMWAPVDRLPTGVSIGDTIDDPNLLTNLQKRTEGGVFLSFSYSFISGIRDVFEKPFKGSDPGAASGASQVTGAVAAPPRPPPTPEPGECEDENIAGVDADGDGVTAETDPDDCDSSDP